jgi:hypothetical protein
MLSGNLNNKTHVIFMAFIEQKSLQNNAQIKSIIFLSGHSHGFFSAFPSF